MMQANASRDDWAQPLAALVACIRRDWDTPGIRAAISKARHRGTPLEIARALLTLTENKPLRTPALLVEDGAHWGPTAPGAPVSSRAKCRVDGHDYYRLPCAACKADELAALAGAVDIADPPTLTPEQAARNQAGAHEALARMSRPLDGRERAAGEHEGDE